MRIPNIVLLFAIVAGPSDELSAHQTTKMPVLVNLQGFREGKAPDKSEDGESEDSAAEDDYFETEAAKRNVIENLKDANKILT